MIKGGDPVVYTLRCLQAVQPKALNKTNLKPYITLNPESLNPKPLNPKPLNPKHPEAKAEGLPGILELFDSHAFTCGFGSFR